jgi:hypothetical protein
MRVMRGTTAGRGLACRGHFRSRQAAVMMRGASIADMQSGHWLPSWSSPDATIERSDAGVL